MQNKEAITTLVVDEDENGLYSLTLLAQNVPGIEVVGTAMNALEALERIKISEPRMVLIDVKMPQMRGMEVTGMIRKQFPNIRVILTSEIDDIEMRTDCLACGAHAFTGKLAVIKQLPMMVGKLFGNEILAS